jgi:hypothetical protein
MNGGLSTPHSDKQKHALNTGSFKRTPGKLKKMKLWALSKEHQVV